MFNQKQLMNQLKKMQQEVVKIQEELKNETIEGKAGEGKVVIRFNGHLEVQSVKLDPALLNPEESDILEDLLVVAFRDGAEKVKALSSKRLSPFTAGLQIPEF